MTSAKKLAVSLSKFCIYTSASSQCGCHIRILPIKYNVNTDLEGCCGHDGSVDDAAAGVDRVEDEEDVDEGEGDHGGAERHQLHVETSHRGVELAPVVKVHDEVAGGALKRF